MSFTGRIVVEWHVWEGEKVTTFSDAREARLFADSCVGFALDQGLPVNIDIRKICRQIPRIVSGSVVIQAQIASAECDAIRLRNLATPDAEASAEKLDRDVLLLRTLLREVGEKCR